MKSKEIDYSRKRESTWNKLASSNKNIYKKISVTRTNLIINFTYIFQKVVFFLQNLLHDEPDEASINNQKDP